MIITLCGLPGVGKSIIGNALYNKLKTLYGGSNVELYDLDLEIEKNSNKSISELLKTSGYDSSYTAQNKSLEGILENKQICKIEDKKDRDSSQLKKGITEQRYKEREERILKFRQIEYQVLYDIVASANEKWVIISLGGGTLNLRESRKLVKNYSRCFYLSAENKAIAQRLNSENEIFKRPLLHAFLADNLQNKIASDKDCTQSHSVNKAGSESCDTTKESMILEWIEHLRKEREKQMIECSHKEIDTTIWDEEKIVANILQYI